MSAFNALCDYEDTFLDELAGVVWEQVGARLHLPHTKAGRRAALWAVVGPEPSIVLRSCTIECKKAHNSSNGELLLTGRFSKPSTYKLLGGGRVFEGGRGDRVWDWS
jgi:hypothetical protein